jgi:hypothetical protein
MVSSKKSYRKPPHHAGIVMANGCVTARNFLEQTQATERLGERIESA